jgi:hypothetical protein
MDDPQTGKQESGEQAAVADEFPPIDNSEFFGKTTVANVTRYLEIYDPHSLDELRAIKAMGFDQVVLDRAPLHADATALGLKVVIANWWSDTTEQATIDESLEFARQVAPGQLTGISVMDEPERNSPDTPFQYYVDLYQQLKPRMLGPLANVRLEISYWGPLASWDQRYYEYFSYLYESADVMRLMPYPDLHEGPLGDVYLMMQRSQRAMEVAAVDIPQVVILQTWVLPPENKLPTIDELRVMAYQAMLGGAETLSFFEYRPELWEQTPGFTEQFAELMQELHSLRARLTHAKIESVLHENGLFDAVASWPSGGTATIRVNTNRHAEHDLQALEIRDGSLPASARQVEQLDQQQVAVQGYDISSETTPLAYRRPEPTRPPTLRRTLTGNALSWRHRLQCQRKSTARPQTETAIFRAPNQSLEARCWR